MNQHLAATIRMIELHGTSATYTRVVNTARNPDTKTVTQTTTNFTVKMYKRNDGRMQFRYPNLVGKEISEFYIPVSYLSIVPEPNDKITFSGETFVVQKITTHAARSQNVLYKIVATK